MDMALAVSKVFLAFSEGEMNGYNPTTIHKSKVRSHKSKVLPLLFPRGFGN
jgi:hypothetical protein